MIKDVLSTGGVISGAGLLTWLAVWIVRESIARISATKEISDTNKEMIANVRAEMQQMRAEHDRQVGDLRSELAAAQAVIKEMLRVGQKREERERERDRRERRLEDLVDQLRSALQKAVRALDSDDPMIRSDAIQAARALTVRDKLDTRIR